MAYVVTKACLGTKDRSCVEVCPVDCFYDIKKKEYNDMFAVSAAHIDDSGGGDDKEKRLGYAHDPSR
jgi:NAD-dependent dihydropyrimidine dehydrogenase PreA subunit